MPWKGQTPVDLRLQFMSRLALGERMTDLCVEFGVSRKTGYKLKQRYDALGVTGLEDQSRAPKHRPAQTPPELVALIEAARRDHPTWGPRKLKVILEEQLRRPLPSASTFGAILVRAGLCERRRHRARTRFRATALSAAAAPNDVWCIDYKGQFRLGDQTYCYPLTVTDQHSRYLLGCDAMAAIDEGQARQSLELLFRTHGLPAAMRSDNGAPFASVGLRGLSQLSVYWMRLGIRLERIRPAHPQDNGQHERMHRTLKQATTRPARANLLQQQEVFDAFVAEFNTARPHEALGMRKPAEVYHDSPRAYPDPLPEPAYPMHDDVLTVTAAGSICLTHRKHVYLARALAGQPVGIREEADGRWLVSFMDLDLGYAEPTDHFTPLPPGETVSPMSPV
jgi:transposase InsO family protein